MDAKHLFRFRSQSCVFKFIRHSVDEALRVYVLRCLISLNVSISVHLPKSLCAQVSDFANRLEYLFHYQRVYVLRCLISLTSSISVPLPKSLCAQMSDFTNRLEYLFHYQRVYVLKCLISLSSGMCLPLPKSLCVQVSYLVNRVNIYSLSKESMCSSV